MYRVKVGRCMSLLGKASQVCQVWRVKRGRCRQADMLDVQSKGGQVHEFAR